MSRLADIVHRRERLSARAEEQRRALAGALAGCRAIVSVADRGLAWGQWVRRHPAALAIAVAGLLAARPRLALRWAARGLAMWRTGRFVLGLVRSVAAARRAGRHATAADHPRTQS